MSSSTSPTTVHVHSNGEIDITQNHVMSTPQMDDLEFQRSLQKLHSSVIESSSSSSPSKTPYSTTQSFGSPSTPFRSASNSAGRITPAIKAAAVTVDDDEVAFEHSLEMIRQLSHYQQSYTPQTYSNIDQKQQHQKNDLEMAKHQYDIEIRAAKAREAALKQHLVLSKSAAATKQFERDLEAEQMKQLQQESANRIRLQATEMLKRRAEQSNQVQIKQFENKLRERSLENLKFVRARLEMEKEQAFRYSA
jgi:hypothetical protein